VLPLVSPAFSLQKLPRRVLRRDRAFLLNLHLLLILIRHNIKNIHQQLRKVLAEQLESGIRAKQSPPLAAASRKYTDHNLNNIIPDSAVRIIAKPVVELTNPVREPFGLERPLEGLLDVPARHGL
jgi:hypothetical protein